MLRPGRLGKLLYVPLPSAEDRISILKALTRKLSLGADVDEKLLQTLGNDPRGNGFSGADLSALVREAGMSVVREWRDIEASPTDKATMDNTRSGNSASSGGGATKDIPMNTSSSPASMISARHFEEALSRVKPSVSATDRRRYEYVHQLIKEGKGAVQALREAQQLS
eukprot:gene4443-8856_t